MLSLGEFTERMDTALAAKTRGELNSVLADLPGITLISDYDPPAYPNAGQPMYQGQPYPAPTYQPQPPPVHPTPPYRPEERRVGKECVRTCRSRGWQDH